MPNRDAGLFPYLRCRLTSNSSSKQHGANAMPNCDLRPFLYLRRRPTLSSLGQRRSTIPAPYSQSSVLSWIDLTPSSDR